MREIKFRAWDEVKHIMVYGIEKFYDTLGCGYDRDGKELDWYEDTSFWSCRSFGDFIDENISIMQFTGLKDKNSKEIYEGDFLNNHDNEIRVVEYSNGSYWLVGKKEHGTVIVDMFEPFILNGYVISAESMEVIGNIYENPELMSAEAKETK